MEDSDWILMKKLTHKQQSKEKQTEERNLMEFESKKLIHKQGEDSDWILVKQLIQKLQSKEEQTEGEDSDWIPIESTKQQS